MDPTRKLSGPGQPFPGLLQNRNATVQPGRNSPGVTTVNYNTINVFFYNLDKIFRRDFENVAQRDTLLWTQL